MSVSWADVRNEACAEPERLRLLISLPTVSGASLVLWAMLYFAASGLIG